MTLPIYSFDQLVSQQQSAMQASSSPLLSFDQGSILLALIEANAGNSMWLQAIASSLLAVTRLATSSGNDVDTFIEDFGFTRSTGPGAGTQASGAVTFSRLSTGIQGIIPVGTIVSVSSINNLTYIVTIPPSGVSYPAYDVTTNSYIIITSALNCLAPVTCQQNGTIGNVNIGQINTINNSLVGVTAVSNAIAFSNGADQWSDAVTKQQFVLYLQSLSTATYGSINYVISQNDEVLRWNLVENQDESGNTQYGFFYAVIDGGNGTASGGLIAAVSGAIEAVRGFTILYDVIAPVPITANVSVTVSLIASPTETNTDIIAKVQAAITAFIKTIPFQQPLFLSRIPELAYDADSNILNVSAYTINSSSSDLAAPLPKNVIIPGTISVTIS